MELDGDYEGNLTIISSYSFYGEEIKVGELKWLSEVIQWAAAAAAAAKLCPTLSDPMDGSPAGSSVHRILQARVLEWVAISFSNACSVWLVGQSCPTLCDPTDCRLPGFSVHGIF